MWGSRASDTMFIHRLLEDGLQFQRVFVACDLHCVSHFRSFFVLVTWQRSQGPFRLKNLTTADVMPRQWSCAGFCLSRASFPLRDPFGANVQLFSLVYITLSISFLARSCPLPYRTFSQSPRKYSFCACAKRVPRNQAEVLRPPLTGRDQQ